MSVAIGACGSDDGSQSANRVDPELVAVGGAWTLVDQWEMLDIAVDASAGTLTVGEPDGTIRRFRVNARTEPDGSTILVLQDDSTTMTWRLALVGNHARVRMAAGDEAPADGYAREGPELFRDAAAASLLADERRRIEATRRSIMLY